MDTYSKTLFSFATSLDSRGAKPEPELGPEPPEPAYFARSRSRQKKGATPAPFFFEEEKTIDLVRFDSSRQ